MKLLLKNGLVLLGRVVSYTEIKIIHPEIGRITHVGERGELCTHGFAVMLGYWGDQEKIKESIDASMWMYFWDLETIDIPVYVSIVVRIKDMIIN